MYNRFAKRVMVIGLACIMGAVAAQAESTGRVTFTKDVLPIFQDNCQACHRPHGDNSSGMIAPMSLMTYQEARPWAKAIAKEVQAHEMPPWDAAPAYHGVFRNERSLTDEEIATIVRWVKTGAVKGNPADAPEPRDFSHSGWRLGNPDLIVTFPEPYFVEDEVQDLYHNVTIILTEDQLPEDKWIQGIEFKPGSEVVHHIIAYSTGPDAAIREDDAEDATGFGNRTMLGGNAPGTDEGDMPEGFGILLEKGSSLTFAMHYHKESGPGTGEFDQSEIAFKFHDKPVTHPVEISTIAHGAFEIPPYQSDWKVVGARTFEEEITILSLMPHTHLRGKYAKYTAYYPDGTDEVLLEVPRYDFNWQIQYEFAKLKQMPAGTRIEFEILFDNSKERADEIGFNPARAVRFGGPTTDEMDLGWLTFSNTEPVEVASSAGD